MTERRLVPDLPQRERALDPGRSCIVQAPAGSGKTELLIQRFLALLARVERPEEIAAITFTIKAAAEMRKRIFESLRAARMGTPPQSPHEARTLELARAALDRNDALGWNLEESADRLRVQTIDALCASLTRQMPVLSRFGAQPETVEDASALYVEAARNVLALLEVEGDAHAQDVARLLAHLDNNAAAAEKLLAGMLERRDHWIRTLARASNRKALEAALQEVRDVGLERVAALWPAAVRGPVPRDIDSWKARAEELLTDKGKWRARHPTAQLLRANEQLRLALQALHSLPSPWYTDAQWDIIEVILRLGRRAIAELHVVFAAHGKADFIEIAQGALRALENEQGPTDLLLALDYRIRHILVDEFQDTSFSQFELLQKLTSGWQPDDGRTLFLVGDPMQSIYRFREAEVGLFLRAWHEGIGGVRLEPLTLAANFRSQAGIVSWVNDVFSRVMPQAEDVHAGAVPYVPSQAVHDAQSEAVTVHAFFDGDGAGEAMRVAEIARAAIQERGPDPSKPPTVAILVRSRTHLLEIIPRLREVGLPFRAIEIEQLGHRPVVQDLLALARALSHLADRTAWLAALRAPWCGLTLADLFALAPASDGRTIWEAMNDASRIAALSGDGRSRLERAREILAKCIVHRRRSSLRAAVEGAWLALGGPACVDNDTDLEDAEIFLDHLESMEAAGALADIAAFEQSIAKLFALPDLAASSELQVMTIHKAKGLEFDAVIVPGLGAGTARDERKLFLWMETPASSLLLAPINATGGEDDPIYEFIRGLDKEKAEHENGRLLYVAATRARGRLHLLGDVKRGDDGEAREPAKGSLLAKLWPALGSQFRAAEGIAAREASSTQSKPRAATLRRLAIGSLEYVVPPAAAWSPPPEALDERAIEFSWVGDTARRVGSVVHRWMQRIAEEGLEDWLPLRLSQQRTAIRKELAARGVAEAELDAAADRVLAALVNAVEDRSGRWVLAPRPGARNECRLSAVVDGVRRHLVIDRMFEEGGSLWIVDYKTSSHEGAGLEAFLAEEENRYRAQLDGYAAALQKPDARRGLYFPLLKAWRECASRAAPRRGAQNLTLPNKPTTPTTIK